MSPQAVTLLLLAFGLAMDATAVSIASAVAAPRVRARDALRIAAAFGFFQGAMPALGWVVGERFLHLIAAWDHWLVLALLGGLGVKMIWEALRHEAAGGAPARRDPFAPATLLTMALATSIDALAAGLTLPTLQMGLVSAVLVIAAVTFVLSLGGVSFGRRLGEVFGSRLEVVGGLVLIGLGVRTVLEHLRAP